MLTRETVNNTSYQKLKKISQRAYSTFPTLLHSYLCAATVAQEGIQGDIAECGVAAGAQVAAIALALQDNGDNRKIHCFDSFCGFPQATENDGTDFQNILGKEGKLIPITTFAPPTDVEHFFSYMDEWGIVNAKERLIIHEGWFQDTIPNAKITKLSILRLDGDLYESTKVCLKLYRRLERTGFCIVDDYALSGCRRAMDEHFGKFKKVFPIEGGNGPVWWRK